MIDHRVNTFVTLCKTKSYTQTAQELCMTQPGVSQHIKYIEKHYKVKLVETTANSFKLTSAGKVFLKYCLQIRSEAMQIQRILQHIGNESQKVSFGATLTIGEFLLPPILKDYIIDHPQTQLSMVVDNTQNLLHKVREGTLDCAFIEGYFNQADFETHLLKKEKFILVASIKNPLIQKKKVTLKDIKEQTLVIREQGSGTREVLENALIEANYPISNFKKVVEIGNLGGIKQLVKANIGIAMLYQVAVKEELERGELVEVPIEDFKLEKAFQFIYMKRSLLEKEYVEFLQYNIKKIDKSSF